MTHPRTDDEASPPPDAALERELRAVSLLLRGLPDPEPPSGLLERIMARIAEREARPRLIRLVFGQPALGTALAAGVAGLAVLGVVSGGLLAPTSHEEPAPIRLTPSPAKLVQLGSSPGANAVWTRRPVVLPFPSGAILDPQNVALIERPAPLAEPRRPTNPLERQLDHQLNQLLLDPAAFYQRLDGLGYAEQFVARLAERAARRGDAAEIALRLRQDMPEHEKTGQLVEHLLWAALSSRGPQ